MFLSAQTSQLSNTLNKHADKIMKGILPSFPTSFSCSCLSVASWAAPSFAAASWAVTCSSPYTYPSPAVELVAGESVVGAAVVAGAAVAGVAVVGVVAEAVAAVVVVVVVVVAAVVVVAVVAVAVDVAAVVAVVAALPVVAVGEAGTAEAFGNTSETAATTAAGYVLLAASPAAAVEA